MGRYILVKDLYNSYRYFGSPKRELINKDFELLSVEQRRDYTVRKEILWESEDATEKELSIKEVEFIRQYNSNDPEIGYNQWPKFKPKKDTKISS
jgi:hypothetical protein